MDHDEMNELHVPFGTGTSSVEKPTPALFPPYVQAQAFISLYVSPHPCADPQVSLLEECAPSFCLKDAR